MSDDAGDMSDDADHMSDDADHMSDDADHMSDDGHGMVGMGHGNAIAVEPGETVEFTYTFPERGTTMIGCHEPGHWDAGMRIRIDVLSA